MEMDEMMDMALAGHCRNPLVWDPSRMCNEKLKHQVGLGNLRIRI